MAIKNPSSSSVPTQQLWENPATLYFLQSTDNASSWGVVLEDHKHRSYQAQNQVQKKKKDCYSELKPQVVLQVYTTCLKLSD